MRPSPYYGETLRKVLRQVAEVCEIMVDALEVEDDHVDIFSSYVLLCSLCTFR
jgi:REP element-mobilizing transposase RayT